MRICLFARAMPEHSHGGMEHHARCLALGLIQRGHAVSVLTTARPGGGPAYVEDPCPTWFLPAPAGRYSAAWWQESAAAFARLHAQAPFDLVWSQSAAGLGYLEQLQPALRVPAVAIMHGSMRGELVRRREPWPSLPGLVRTALYLPEYVHFARRWRRAGPRLSRAIVPSAELAADNQRELRLPPERVPVVPLGVDLARFRPDPAAAAALRGRLGLAPEAPVLLVAGRLSRQKGAHVALAALQRLRAGAPPPYLLLAGEGREAGPLQRTAARLGVAERVLFLGRVPQEELAACYNLADLCLFPWLGWEAFPLSLLEALACGRPVVASCIGGAPSLLQMAEVGRLVPPGDACALTGAIASLLAEPDQRRRMASNARALAEAEFGLETMVVRTEAIFASCLEGGAAHE